MRSIVAAATAVFAVVLCLSRAEGFDEAKAKEAVKKRAASYVAAFNARDAKALAEHWLPEAVYINPLSGVQVEGREAIAEEFKAIFAELKEAKLAVQVEAVRFISPSVAVEDGVARLQTGDEKLEETRYTAVHVKRDGQWYLDRVTEEEVPVVLTHYDRLKELEWMIGTWMESDEGSGTRVKTTCQWSRNQNFLIRWFDVAVEDRIDLAGVQIIAWDPAAKQIRSWVFDTDGGFGEARWTKKDDRWYVTTTSTLADGRKASAVNVITPVDARSFRWKSVNRIIDGQLLPNVDEVVLVRAEAPD